MGSWGVKTTESDSGLDFLLIAERKYLQERNFKQFNVSEIMELLKNSIIEEIRHTNRGSSKADMAFYIEVNFPCRYEQAVILMVELLADYFERGKIVIDVFEKGKRKPTHKNITNIIYSLDDLGGLLEALQTILAPGSDTYSMWEESESLDEWQSHIQSLCDCLQNQIDGKNY